MKDTASRDGISLRRITDTTDSDYAFMEQLITQAFPREEYRDLAELRRLTESSPLFHNNIIIDEKRGGIPVGLITFWKLPGFYYLEHFATSPEARNGGIGARTLRTLTDLLGGEPMVLEVEEPTGELEQRRIGFYTREGFRFWEKDYLQPPYREGDGFLRLYLMAKGRLDPERDFPAVRDAIHREVYGYHPEK